ncbi:MAG: hypothetical protein AB8H79_00255 [Myxococcota bacterium]
MSEAHARSLVLVSAHPERCLRRVTEAWVAPPSVRSIAVEDLGALPLATIAMIDVDGLGSAAMAAATTRAQRCPDRTLFVVPPAGSQALSTELAQLGSFRHVLSEQSRNLDFRLTIDRLLGDPDPGVQAYVPGVDLREHALRGADDRQAALALVEDAAQAHSIPGRLTELALTVAEELVTNALYNAPVAPDGAPMYRHLSRATPLPAPVRPPGRIQVACDGLTLVIAVRDAFGSFPLERIDDDLRRMVQPSGHQVVGGEGGAGLGLVMAYRGVEHLHIDLVPGRSTQVIGIIGLQGGFRRFARAGHSFNLFISEDA